MSILLSLNIAWALTLEVTLTADQESALAALARDNQTTIVVETQRRLQQSLEQAMQEYTVRKSERLRREIERLTPAQQEAELDRLKAR